MTQKSWSLSVLLSGSFHNKFLDFSLLIHSVSWDWVQILYLWRCLFSSFVQIQQFPKSKIFEILTVEDGRILAGLTAFVL